MEEQSCSDSGRNQSEKDRQADGQKDRNTCRETDQVTEKGTKDKRPFKGIPSVTSFLQPGQAS